MTKKKTVKKKPPKKKKSKVKTKPVNRGGRPLFDGKNKDVVIQKLETIWSLGGSDAEAAFFAKISCASLSDYLKKNPDVSERKDRLKEKPILKARKSVIKGLTKDPHFALRYLERVRSKEFGQKLKVDADLKGKLKGNIHHDVVALVKEAEKDG